MRTPQMEVIRIANENGMELEVCDFGATLVSLKVPDRQNRKVNVVVGLNRADQYAEEEFLDHNLFLGGSIGRFAGRIANGTFKLEGKEYNLPTENNIHLHSGKSGFYRKKWDFTEITKSRNPSVQLSYYSEHMEGGYPGNLEVKVVYEILESNALKITYSATTDTPTIVNLTNHAYFNLDGGGTIAEHFLQLHSKKRLVLDKNLVPTGEIVNCSRTHFDFERSSKILNRRFKGFDNPFVLSKKPMAAKLFSKKSGIYMNVYTKQPSLVIYTPRQFPDLDFYAGADYSLFPAICLETQNFPDAPNHNNFPSPVLLPGETYTNETIFDFGTILLE